MAPVIDTALPVVAPPLMVIAGVDPVPETVLLIAAVPPVAVTVMLLPLRAPPVVTLFAPVRDIVVAVTLPVLAIVTLCPEFSVTLVVLPPPMAKLTRMSLATEVDRFIV